VSMPHHPACGSAQGGSLQRLSPTQVHAALRLSNLPRTSAHVFSEGLRWPERRAASYLLGDARSLQREMLTVLCPDLDPTIADRVLPERRSLVAALSDSRFGAVQSLRSILPMEEVLFGGIGYAVAVRAGTAASAGDGAGFLETFLEVYFR